MKFKNEDLEYITPHLKLLGATSIAINFDGSGDSGEITEIICHGVDLKQKVPTLETEKKYGSYEDVLLAISYAFLEDKEDWYNNEGGYGSIKIDLLSKTITCEMHIRVTHEEDYEHKAKF